MAVTQEAKRKIEEERKNRWKFILPAINNESNHDELDVDAGGGVCMNNMI